MNRDTVVQENIHCRICLISFKLIDVLSFILFSINSMWLETLKSQHRLNQTCSPLYIFTIYTLFNVKISFYSTYFRIFFSKISTGESTAWEVHDGRNVKMVLQPLYLKLFLTFLFFLVYTLCFFYLYQWHGWNISCDQIITLATLLHCKPQPILASNFSPHRNFVTLLKTIITGDQVQLGQWWKD